MIIHFHPHALERMNERGATEDEVKITIEQGEQFPAKFGRTGFRRNFIFENKWRDKYYQTKQIETYVIQEDTCRVVIIIIVRYF